MSYVLTILVIIFQFNQIKKIKNNWKKKEKWTNNKEMNKKRKKRKDRLLPKSKLLNSKIRTI